MIVLALSLSSCKSKNIETSSEVSAQNKLPAFSWDKMPLYMHVRKSTAFTNKEIKYLAKFPLITLEKTTGSKTYGSTENGTLAASKAIKKINPYTKVLYYKNVVINWRGYKEDDLFLKENPQAYLFNTLSKKALMSNGRTGFFDISQEYVRKYWLNHVKKITESPFIDGVFMDANIKVLVPGFFKNKVGVEKQKAIKAGYFSMMKNLKSQLGNDNLLIANMIRARPDFKNSGREFLKYFDGSYLEGFDKGGFGTTYADYLAKGIEAFQKSAREGKVIAMSIGLGKSLKGEHIGIDDLRESVEINENLNSRLDYVLALFLVCAEKYSYVYPHDGYKSNTSATWLKTFPQYEKPLGKPLGFAKRNGYIYTRQFEHLDVWLDIENKTAKLNYK
ncbi:putative glycoside hydrolase [uncultured Polaribacter sp.]|uniref:putative glycoside hydrolase n=1 Tax=uncultured Polaribacter sp. TaxID=174711 RepID=UPI00262A95B1|nr:putative glycoside hydrolase [uncultured Polaribacter sp.]